VIVSTTWISLLVLAAMLAACTGERGESLGIPLEWTAVDSVNAQLPSGIRVYAGHNAALPLRAWYVSIAERQSDLETRVVVSDDPEDRRETVSSFATLPDACVAANAGYFAMNRTPAVHAGLLFGDGAVHTPATRTVTRDSVSYPVARAAIGFGDDDRVELAWVTTRNDSLFAWTAPPDHRPGLPAELAAAWPEAPWDVRDAVSAGPMLLWQGDVRVTADEEVFFGSAIPEVHPRTAAGRTVDGQLIILVVDGRQLESRGVSLEELAGIMRDLGVVDALNLDGGGSSALVVGGTLLNRPTGRTAEREVMSALVTFCSRTPDAGMAP
jgi:hypothetical protein